MPLAVWTGMTLFGKGPGVDPSQQWIGPGLLGFAVIMALIVVTVLLWRNMNKQLRKVHERYGDQDPPEDDGGDGSGDEPPSRATHGGRAAS